MQGSIFALDLAVRTGFAVGPVGDVPRSGAIILKDKGEPRAVALGNLFAFLHREWSTSKPVLVVVEAPLQLQAYKKQRNSAERVRMDYSMHGIVEGMAARFGIRLEAVHDATIRKHFIDRGRMGARDLTKSTVVGRCHALGYMPRTSSDDNRADALAAWDWAAYTLGRRVPRELVMFNETPRTATLVNPRHLPSAKTVKSIADRAQASSSPTAQQPRETSPGSGARQAASCSELEPLGQDAVTHGAE